MRSISDFGCEGMDHGSQATPRDVAAGDPGRVVDRNRSVHGAGDAKDQEGASALARQARGVLKQYCFRCHHGEGSEGGDFDMLKQPELLSKDVRDPPLVAAGKPAESYLFERIAKNQMPPKNIKERPADAEKELIRRWIEAGAPAFPDDATRRSFITLVSVLSAARDHLRNADATDRPFLRFFTLHTLANNPSVTDDDLRSAARRSRRRSTA